MKLTIDNSQGQGAVDYTAALDGTVAPKIERRLNRPTAARFALVANSASYVAPVMGARVTIEKANGSDVFTGYVTEAPQFEYLGWGEQAPVYRYNVVATSDEFLLDQKVLPNRAPFVNKSAGQALRQLAQDLLPSAFDMSAVQDVCTLASYFVNPQKTFSYHAAELAVVARASYRAMNGALILAPVGTAKYELSESDSNFSPSGLTLANPNLLVNYVTAIGLDEPQDYVRDYFIGDGLSLKFYLSQKPFGQAKPALIDEEYPGPGLDTTTWVLSDPAKAVSVSGQTLLVAGGTGVDGQTTVNFIEQIELGGALALQHGDVSVTRASRGVLGGLYAGTVSAAGCLAGFQLTPSGAGSSIQALINGTLTGPALATVTGHRYVLTTYIYSMEVYRSQEIFHSSLHPAGNGWGGAAVAADARVVLEVHDIDPSVPATLVAQATVLYDGVISNAPGFCTYALVNALDLHCSIAYTYVSHISLAEVRTALPAANYVTQLVGSLSDGAQCLVTNDPALYFYPQYAPPLNQLIVANYRAWGRAVAEVNNSASVASLQNGMDDGVRGIAREVKTPSARTSTDCENAALAILEDAGGAAWSGTYQTWSDFLPGAASDIFPGDAIEMSVPSRGAAFTAIVRQVTIEVRDPTHDRGVYTIEFANDLAAPLALQVQSNSMTVPLQDIPPHLTTEQVGAYYLPDLTDAQIMQVNSTTVQVDAGLTPGNGEGIEVRAHNYGWGQANDRNLLGRFSAQTFNLPRLARTQNYFLRIFDSSSPPRYSRYSAALHVDFPL